MANRKQDSCAYVLWAEYYDEVVATLCASALREAGWRTKLVGLQGDKHTGRHGTVLVADTALSEALVSHQRLICIVAPCAPEQLDTQRDGRLGDFLERGQQERAHFLAKAAREAGSSSSQHWPATGMTIPDAPEEVIPLIHLLIEQLENVC